MNTQLIVDNLENIVRYLWLCEPCRKFQFDRTNRAWQDNGMPVGLVVFANKGYGDIPPLVTPVAKRKSVALIDPINTKHAASSGSYQSAVCW